MSDHGNNPCMVFTKSGLAQSIGPGGVSTTGNEVVREVNIAVKRSGIKHRNGIISI
jgi:hypothetical protein